MTTYRRSRRATTRSTRAFLLATSVGLAILGLGAAAASARTLIPAETGGATAVADGARTVVKLATSGAQLTVPHDRPIRSIWLEARADTCSTTPRAQISITVGGTTTTLSPFNVSAAGYAPTALPADLPVSPAPQFARGAKTIKVTNLSACLIYVDNVISDADPVISVSGSIEAELLDTTSVAPDGLGRGDELTGSGTTITRLVFWRGVEAFYTTSAAFNTITVDARGNCQTNSQMRLTVDGNTAPAGIGNPAANADGSTDVETRSTMKSYVFRYPTGFRAGTSHRIGLAYTNDSGTTDPKCANDRNLYVDKITASTRLEVTPPPIANIPGGTAPREVLATSADQYGNLLLKAGDQIVKLPDDAVVGGLRLQGRETGNVKIVGGEIRLNADTKSVGAGIRIVGSWRDDATVYIEGVKISSDAHIQGDGIQIASDIPASPSPPATPAPTPNALVDAPNLIVQNVSVSDLKGCNNTEAGCIHADVVQTYGGSEGVALNRVTGSSNYQGLFLRPEGQKFKRGGTAKGTGRIDVARTVLRYARYDDSLVGLQLCEDANGNPTKDAKGKCNGGVDSAAHNDNDIQITLMNAHNDAGPFAVPEWVNFYDDVWIGPGTRTNGIGYHVVPSVVWATKPDYPNIYATFVPQVTATTLNWNNVRFRNFDEAVAAGPTAPPGAIPPGPTPTPTPVPPAPTPTPAPKRVQGTVNLLPAPGDPGADRDFTVSSPGRNYQTPKYVTMPDE